MTPFVIALDVIVAPEIASISDEELAPDFVTEKISASLFTN